MPCDYSKYPANWKTEIRPAILERDGNKCKFCKVPNKAIVCRGTWQDKEVWQDDDGNIYDANTGEFLGEDYVGEVFTNEKQTVTKIVLTVMHLDHNVNNNEYSNLAAGCQRCHLKHDRGQHKETKQKKKGIQKLF